MRVWLFKNKKGKIIYNAVSGTEKKKSLFFFFFPDNLSRKVKELSSWKGMDVYLLSSLLGRQVSFHVVIAQAKYRWYCLHCLCKTFTFTRIGYSGQQFTCMCLLAFCWNFSTVFSTKTSSDFYLYKWTF